jgi:hypothetical protein
LLTENSDETAALVSLPNLMDHIDTIQYFSQWQAEVASAKLAGVPFHMGETGSVSCHGKDGVSNTLGAALWELDYMLHGKQSLALLLIYTRINIFCL